MNRSLMPNKDWLQTWQRRLTLSGLILGISLLGGCIVVQAVYNNAELAIRWMVRDYVTMHGAQESDYHARLARFHTWHRHNELPEYASLAKSASERIARGLSAEDIRWFIDASRARSRVLLGHAIDEAVPVLLSFDAQQIDTLEKGFEKSNRKMEKERLQADPKKRLKERIKRIQNNYERVLDHLTEAQEESIAEMVRRTPDNSEFQLAERKRTQQELLTMLRAHASAADVNARLHELLVDPEKLRDAKYTAAYQAAEQANSELVLNLSRSLSVEQRRDAVKQFADYANDFSLLAREAKN